MTNPNSGEVGGERLDRIANDMAVQPSKSKAAIPPRGCRSLPEGYAEGEEGSMCTSGSKSPVRGV
jgi:hypothetical protein